MGSRAAIWIKKKKKKKLGISTEEMCAVKMMGYSRRHKVVTLHNVPVTVYTPSRALELIAVSALPVPINPEPSDICYTRIAKIVDFLYLQP